jgi:hypothetical protein
MPPSLQRPHSPSTVPLDAGDELFYASVLGSVGGTVASGFVGLVTHNAGPQSAGDPVVFAFFAFAVLVAAIGVGSVLAFAWDIVIEGPRRSPEYVVRNGTFNVALVTSAVAAVLFMLVAQPLAVPVALLTIALPTLWVVGVLLWIGFKSKVLRG